MVISEDLRVKIPCILHLVCLGYRYLSLQETVWDNDTNIFPALFDEAIARINPELSSDEVTHALADVKLLLDNEDLGKMAVNTVENQQLNQLRDWLLPLLMNGQVTVA